MYNGEKCILYRTYKNTFGFENYLKLPVQLRRPLCKLRTSNHKLAVERGRYPNLPRHERTCEFCDQESLGDEFHFLLECSKLKTLRQKYIPVKYWKRPNVLLFSSLLNCKSKSVRVNLAKFIKESFRLCGI